MKVTLTNNWIVDTPILHTIRVCHRKVLLKIADIVFFD